MYYEETLSVNGKNFTVQKLLGKGKSGYSYLVTDDDGRDYVLKQIHHEPCEYYKFGDKLDAEVYAFRRLKQTGINIPEMLDFDERTERILKEYIAGDTIYDLVLNDRMKPEYVEQMKKMCGLLYAEGMNIDYFPTNFIVRESVLYYIDYEFNDYCEQWNFEKWGIKYWSKTEEFLRYAAEHE